jgi:hypothetical protein
MTTYSLRLLEKTEDGGVITWRAADYDGSVLASTADGAAGPVPGSMVGVTALQFEAMDIPLLAQEDDAPGIYVAAAPAIGTWRGAVVYRSRDGGTTYTEAAQLNTAATLGRCESVLGDWEGGNQIDVSSWVDVVVSGELETITAAALLEGGNRALIGDEVVHFRRATLLSAGRYRLSGFLRGRLGTEEAQGTHTETDRFVLLDEAVVRLPEQLGDRGKAMRYRCVALGDQVTQGPVQTINPLRFVSLLPLAPINVNLAPIATGGQSVRWTWRTRYAAPLADGSDAPLGEATERYSLRIVQAGLGGVADAVLDTETTTNTYTLADGYEERVLQVAQISATVGNGTAARVTTGA